MAKMTLISLILHQCHALFIFRCPFRHIQAQFIPKLKRRGFLAYLLKLKWHMTMMVTYKELSRQAGAPASPPS